MGEQGKQQKGVCEQQGGPFQLFRGKVWAELCRWCVCARPRTVSYACCVFVVLSVSCAVCVCVSERFHSHSHLLPSPCLVKWEASSTFIQTYLGLSGDLPGSRGQCLLASQGKARPPPSVMMKVEGNRWASGECSKGPLRRWKTFCQH